MALGRSHKVIRNMDAFKLRVWRPIPYEAYRFILSNDFCNLGHVTKRTWLLLGNIYFLESMCLHNH